MWFFVFCKNSNATIRDKIYIHNEALYDEPCWKKITNGRKDKFIIYPYDNGKIIEEEQFKNLNPQTYKYLLNNKIELSKRDKGKKKYVKWYAYGRSQSIKYIPNECLYIPTFINPKEISNNITKRKNILHISCLCIEPQNDFDIEYIKKIIIKNINFIKQNSTKRSGGWISLSSRILYQIPLE